MTTYPTRSTNPDQARQQYRMLKRDGAGVAVRIIGATKIKGGWLSDGDYNTPWGGSFDDEDAFVNEVRGVQDVSVYAMPNPVDPICLNQKASNRLVKLKSGEGVQDKDIICHAHLYIDIDPPRPPGKDVSATDEEREKAIRVRDDILTAHPEIRAASVWGTSGNGGFILAQIEDLPNNEESRETIGQALASLAQRFDRDGATVDTKCKNPSRLAPLPGTWKCKGSHRTERPWRPVWTDGGAEPRRPLDLPAWVASNPPREEPEGKQQAPKAVKGAARRQPKGAAGRPDLRNRIRDYLDTMGPAVAHSAEGGHKKALNVACRLYHDWGLSVDEARPYISEWSATCQPPWSPGELEHKLSEAVKQSQAGKCEGERGRLVNEGRDEPARNGKAEANGAVYHGVASMPPDQDGVENRITDDPGRLKESEATNPHAIARFFVGHCYAPPFNCIFHWNGEFYAYTGAHYSPVSSGPGGELRGQIADQIDREYRLIHEKRMEKYEKIKNPKCGPPQLLPVTTGVVSNVVQALAGEVALPVALVSSLPTWDPRGPQEGPAKDWCAEDVLATKSGLIHLPSALAGQPCQAPPTPNFLNTFSLDYNFDPNAPEPAEWLRFLRQLWRDDPKSIETLQEWFGLMLTADTSYQKMLFLLGPPRSGKGTITRVLRGLIGPSNVASPVLADLGARFGLSDLVGKPVAVVPDARLSGRADAVAVVERLLSISGEDAQSVDRKFKDPWSGRLPTRFMLISNEVPRLIDTSGALASRLILLALTESFLGREDKGLGDRLLAERPGILRWAIQGWGRLQARGHFLQPASGQDLLGQMAELSSPMSKFLEERCQIGEGCAVAVSELYDAWKAFCEEQGRKFVGDQATFGRDLHAAVPRLKRCHPRDGEKRVWTYEGIGLRADVERPMAPHVAWLHAYLMRGVARQHDAIEHAASAGFTPEQVFSAARAIAVDKEDSQGSKTFSLPPF